MARRVDVSRAILYRLEKGALKKVETLERVAGALDVSLASLMGVGAEYYRNAAAFFERKRQLEEQATQVQGNFMPVSFLLMSDEYIRHLRTMLLESPACLNQPDFTEYVDRVLQILRERRNAGLQRRASMVSVISSQTIERFLHWGLIGRYDLKANVLRKRRLYAKQEVERLVGLFRKQPIGVQVGIVHNVAPDQTFQLYESSAGSAVTLSPYRLGEHPNISTGIAIVSLAPEAVSMFREIISEQWDRAHKGERGAKMLETILARVRL